jgi:hypothetical protein
MGFHSDRRARLAAAIAAWKARIENDRNEAVKADAISKTNSYYATVETVAGSISTLSGEIDTLLGTLDNYSADSQSSTNVTEATTANAGVVSTANDISNKLVLLMKLEADLKVAYDGLVKFAGSYTETAESLAAGISYFNTSTATISNYDSTNALLDAELTASLKKIADIQAAEAQLLATQATTAAQTVSSQLSDYLPLSDVDTLKRTDLNYVDFIVDGDADTYYPVGIDGGAGYGWNRYTITRRYSWAAPSTWNTASHKGGLTFTFSWSGDSAWGGNDHNIRVEQFSEQYSNMVGGMALAVSGGPMMIWLRGGGAQYRVYSPGGTQVTPEVHYTAHTAADGSVYSPRTNLNNVQSEILSRFPVRGHGDIVPRSYSTMPSGVSGQIAFDVNTSRMNWFDGSEWKALAEDKQPYLYRTIITTGYVAGGYKDTTPWKNVNRVSHATDVVTDLGNQMPLYHSYGSGANSLTTAFMWGGNSSGAHPTNSVDTSAFSMATETGAGTSSSWNMRVARIDAGTAFKEAEYAFILGGGSAAIDVMNLTNQSMYTTAQGSDGYDAGDTMQQGVTALSDEWNGFFMNADGQQKISFSTTSAYTLNSTSVSSAGSQQQGLNSKLHRGWCGNEGTYLGGYNLRRWDLTTETNLGTVAKPHGNSGEENFDMGQAHQYMLGCYDGNGQVNTSWRFNYSTETGVVLGAGSQSVGVPGRSSGHGFWKG